MCSGDRLVADFVAGTDTRPDVPEVLQEHLTTTIDGTWVVWAHKLAWQQGDLFMPLTGGPGYPADARARCRRARGKHDAPDPSCTCGFHAVSNPALPGLPVSPEFTALTVALSGRVLAFEWAGGGRCAARSPVAPRDSGPVRLRLPVSAPVLPVDHDDAGWCVSSRTFEHPPAALVLT
jgi:hypothetical protein